METFELGGRCFKWIYRKWITVKGKRIYPTKASVFKFKVEIPCSNCK